MTHAEDDGWPLKLPIKKLNAKNVVTSVVGLFKNAVSSVKEAFAFSGGQLAFA